MFKRGRGGSRGRSDFLCLGKLSLLLLMVLVSLLVLLVAFEKTTRCVNAVKGAVRVLSLSKSLP